MPVASPFRSTGLALGAALLVTGLAGATAARADTLQDALTEAYDTNPQLLSERAHLRAVDENVPQALANWRPTVSFTGSAGAERTTNSPSEPNLTYLLAGPGCVVGIPCSTGIPVTLPSSLPAVTNVTPQTIDVNITQPLYRGGRTIAQTAEAEKTVEAERARLIVTEESVFYSVIQAYLDVVRDQATLELSINNEQLLSKQLESTREQFRVGTLTRTDVAQAEAQYASAIASRNQAEGTLQVSRANYERAVGHLPPKLTATSLRPVLPATRDQAITLAANKNPNVIAALFAEDAARDQVKVIRGQLLPTLSVVGDYQRLNDTEFPRSDTTVASVVARMSMPLYEGGAIYSQTRQAEQTVGQMRGQTDDARRAAVQGATQAWETMTSDRAQEKALVESVTAADVAFHGTQEEQRVGTRTVLDVLITEQTLFSAQVSLVSTRHDVALAEFNLALQIGRLSAADLSLKVRLYDVNRHYHAVRDKWVGFGSGQQ
ncbi:MAG TPA: TolC family outer membrane protein [Stellaceae bacterium]|jgi:outer membrane protein|nr:TolC family outer membrane protein [Stellaceae bacterium]